MASFTCKLGTGDGTIVVREFEANDPETLRHTLEEQGYFVFDVRKKPFQFLAERAFGSRRIDSRSLLTFNQELLVLIKAGMPIIQALDTILERADKGRLREILTAVREDIKGGAALSDAFEKFPGVFPHLYVALIRAGERTGDLPQTIRRFIQFTKRMEGFRKKVVSALFYPSILLVAVTIAVTLLLVYVVPTFSQIYADSGAHLPLPTQVLIAFTRSFRGVFPFLLLGGVVLAVALKRYAGTMQGKFRIDRLILSFPLIGPLSRVYSTASFTRTLSTVLGGGIPLVEAIRMTTGTLNNLVLERRLLEAVKRVEEGTQLSVALEREDLMPPLAIRMISVGETTGALVEMLSDISDFFEEEIDQKLSLLTTAIEPVIMVFMGVVVGGIIVTMYLPIFRIAGTLG